jgi:hypothetical protein
LSFAASARVALLETSLAAFFAWGSAKVVKTAQTIREGVRVALADCEALFRVREPNKRMRDKAAHACRALCRARVTEELGAGERR